MLQEVDMTGFDKLALEAAEAVDRSEAGSPDFDKRAADKQGLARAAAFPTLAGGQKSAAQKDFPSAG